ncbi:2715_t:CDS:1 [Acaulospora colombiana]|uniref:2715_t:CDS:1 n=1 Tax=Acaulospora colombiana TaxID=27376 RepID=A0ACA9K564_9GLOM|nr:2715_t:CDS:1 [Acaulospora colombiana]
MGRGNSLVDDLSSFVNNPLHSDLEIVCEDGVLYGHRVILAARSDVLDPLLSNGMEESFKNQIKFPEIKESVMKIILRYLYTGSVIESDLSIDIVFNIFQAADFFQLDNLKDHILEFYRKTCKERNNAPELLSKAVQHITPVADNAVIDFLVDSISKISLNNIESGQLSFQALQCLLSRTFDKKNGVFCTNEYSVLRFAILSAAGEVAQNTSILEKKIPAWEEIKDEIKRGFDLKKYEDMSDILDIRVPIANKLSPLIDFIDLRRIDGLILADIIEPLDLIKKDHLYKIYRSYARREYFSPFRGISCSRENIKWEKNGCSQNLIISPDGYTVYHEGRKGYQSIRTNLLMDEGFYELHIKIEKLVNEGGDVGFGVCGEGLDYLNWAGCQKNGWVLSTNATALHNEHRTPIQMPPFRRVNVEVIVHLDMENKTCAFTIDGKSYPPIAEWKDFPPRLYFAASLSSGSQLKILT